MPLDPYMEIMVGGPAVPLLRDPLTDEEREAMQRVHGEFSEHAVPGVCVGRDGRLIAMHWCRITPQPWGWHLALRDDVVMFGRRARLDPIALDDVRGSPVANVLMRQQTPDEAEAMRRVHGERMKHVVPGICVGRDGRIIAMHGCHITGQPWGWHIGPAGDV